MKPDKLSEASLGYACRQLAAADRRMARVFRRHGSPPLWSRRGGLRCLVQIILEQQVSLASGRATIRRVEGTFGRISADCLVRAGEDGLRSAGVTRQKARYCVLLADASRRGELDLRAVARAPDAAALRLLTRFKGVGRWTAEVYLLMALLRPDVWPAGDLALAKAVQSLLGLSQRPGEDDMRRIAEPWRPFRAVAARLLWQDYLSQNATAA
jgi:DNA-3-methyladenine glycosylase II